MKFKLNTNLSTQQMVIAFFFLSFAIYLGLILIGGFPFIYDEGWYALMVKDFSENPSVVSPALAGEPVEWKPPLFVWVYSVFYLLLQNLPLPIECIMRIPSAVFGAASISLGFIVANTLYGKRVAIASAILILTSNIVIFSSTLVMMEAFALFLALATIHFYINKKLPEGMLFLGLLTLSKWLYVLAPVIFITIHFLGNRNLKQILLSYVSIPMAIGFHLVVAFFFGSFENAVMNLTFDLTRPSPSLNLIHLSGNYIWMLFRTFPLSLLFVLHILFRRIDLWKERSILALGALAFVLPLSSNFIFWYIIISIPAFAFFVSRRLEELNHEKLFLLVLSGLVVLNIIFSIPVVNPDTEVKEVSSFMKGKNVTILEQYEFFSNWRAINERYMNTDRSYLLLEQFNPGILFYRFNETKDYHNLNPLFMAYGDTPSCGSYLIVHKASYEIPEYPEVPGCFKLVREFKLYRIYESVPAQSVPQ